MWIPTGQTKVEDRSKFVESVVSCSVEVHVSPRSGTEENNTSRLTTKETSSYWMKMSKQEEIWSTILKRGQFKKSVEENGRSIRQLIRNTEVDALLFSEVEMSK